MNLLELKQASKNQADALFMIYQSEQNLFDLSLEEIKLICESDEPEIISDTTIKFVSEEHKTLWHFYLNNSPENICNIMYADMIINTRLLSDLLEF